MVNGIIVNNNVFCPTCKNIVGHGTGDYKLINRNGNSYVQFVRFCSNPKCQEKIVYYADITLDFTTRYSFTRDIQEVKDDSNN